MRSLRSFMTRWPISALCIAVLLGPIITAVLPTPAAAQSGTMEVAVVDFLNNSKISDPMYAKMATDAVVVELVRSGKFSVTADDALKTKMVELGLKGQEDQTSNILLSDASLQRLGQEVGAASVITGEVRSITIDEKKKKAEVLVAVRMLDVASREWINGAIATGVSHARISYNGEKDTDWIIEAINDAGRKAVENMVSYIIPEATIIGTYGTNEVEINKGSQEGIETGMNMIVLRRGETGLDEVVGRVRVTDVSDTNSKAKVVQSTRGVKPEDRVRAVYELPKVEKNGSFQSSAASKEKRVSKSKNLLWGLVALVGIATFMGGGSGNSESVPGGVAVAGVSPDAAQEFDVFSDGGIMIMWNSPKHIRTQDIIQYHIWKDNVGSYGDGGSNILGPSAIADEFAVPPMSSILGSFDHQIVMPAGYYSTLTYTRPSDDHSSVETVSVDHTDNLQITLGKTHQFWISCVYRRFNPTSGAYTYWETTPAFCGRATILARPEPVGPGGTVASETVDMSDITFSWYGSRGADQYVIELCPYPDFRRDMTWVKQYYQVTSDRELFNRNVTFTDGSDPHGLKAWMAEMQKQGKLTEADPVVYWRVGARNSKDVPGPYPSGDANAQKDGAKSTRYIYSDPNLTYSFNTIDDVPPPPN